MSDDARPAPDLDADYWSARYASGETGWDVGHANLGLVEVVRARVDPRARILIPGAGRGYEAEWLWRAGFTETYVCDWAEPALAELARSPALPGADRLIVADFFELAGDYDLVLEQTFFCAIDPGLRRAYVRRVGALLRPGGRLLGVLFDREFAGGPPFGGSEPEYRRLFEEVFTQVSLTKFAGSIPPRRGTELLIEATGLRDA